MILSSNLVWLDDIAKLWAFEVEGSKWQNRQYHTLTAKTTGTTPADIYAGLIRS